MFSTMPTSIRLVSAFEEGIAGIKIRTNAIANHFLIGIRSSRLPMKRSELCLKISGLI